MKKVIGFLLLSVPVFAWAQKTHTVAAKESFYSIGRMYNVHPKDLASFNNIPFEKGLSIGQVIKIPDARNASPMPDVPAPAATTSIPVKPEPVKTETVKAVPAAKTGSPIYHTVAPKEGLYGISKKYNVSIADIKKWNNLSGDGLSIGSNLIVGYGGSAASRPAEPVVVKEVPEAPPVVVKKEEPRVTETRPAPAPREERQPVETAPVSRDAVVERGAVNYNGGYFKAAYNQQAKGSKESTERGVAGIFKSTSGWEDGKYYCLHNSAPAGTLVKITNTANNKTVYAKVLDLIPDLKQNSNIIIRVSNAAAAELGIAGNSNFDCTIQY
ncbi:MAG: LysM peptidoglycan-binding domain-containing protein [Ferruginibacter sp.]